MYTKRIIGNKKRESEYWFQIKKAWLQVKYKERWTKISKKEFFRNFLHYLEKYGIEWDYTDKKGNPKIPDLNDYEYANKNGCFSKYQWDECFEKYEFDHMNDAQKNARKIYDKGIEEKVIENERQTFEINVHINEMLQEQKENNEHHEYRIAKDVETKNNLDDNSRKLLGLDKEEQNDTPGTIPVPLTPEHEDQHIRDIWTERARQDVIPR